MLQRHSPSPSPRAACNGMHARVPGPSAACGRGRGGHVALSWRPLRRGGGGGGVTRRMSGLGPRWLQVAPGRMRWGTLACSESVISICSRRSALRTSVCMGLLSSMVYLRQWSCTMHRDCQHMTEAPPLTAYYTAVQRSNRITRSRPMFFFIVWQRTHSNQPT